MSRWKSWVGRVFGAGDGVGEPAPRDQPAAAWKAAGVAALDAGDAKAAADAFRRAVAAEPECAEHHVNAAYALGLLGATADRLTHLRRAAALDDESFDAHYMLGMAAAEAAAPDEAAHHFRRALALRPEFSDARVALCRTLALADRRAEAQAELAAAIAAHPSVAELHLYLGNLHMTAGEPAAALTCYERACALSPKTASLHANRGLAHQALHQYELAQTCFDQALQIDPSAADVHAKAGSNLRQQGRLADAEAVLARALELRPDEPEVLNELGMVLQEMGQPERSEKCFRGAVALRPDLPGGYANLGLALYEQGRVGEAVEVYRKGLAIKSIAEMHDNLAIALQKQGVVDEAIYHYQQALALQPDNVNTRCNLAAAMMEDGEPAQAIAAFREIVRLKPDHLVAHSNLLFHLSTSDECSVGEYLAEARRFDGRLTARPLPPAAARPRPDGEALRVGIVSGDLRSHPVGFFLEGMLAHLDRSRVQLHAYATNAKSDEMTARMRPLFAGWRSLKGLGDEAAAQLIRADAIDILIDLAGHSGDNRLPVFAFRPAPVQVSWLGYFASTGVSAIDYVLADEVCVPPGSEWMFTEKVWRLPVTRMCFTPPAANAVPEVSPLPALTNGHITFGCFQRLEKVTPRVLQLWGRVFAAVPEARLLLQSHQTGRDVYVRRLLDRLMAVGIAPDRVEIRPPAHRSQYLRSYHAVDVVLDTFPYTGGTTTCEALWMGVPTLTRSGATMIARQGVAMLQAAGLSHWIAQDDEDYIRKARDCAQDIPRLARERASLRAHLPTTALFDVRIFAQRWQAALLALWEQRLADGKAVPDASTSRVTD